MTTNSGISKAMPKTSIIRMMKLRYLSNSIRLLMSLGVKPIRTSIPFGST